MSSVTAAVLAAIAQLRREQRVTAEGSRQLKRAVVRGDLRTMRALQGGDGQEEGGYGEDELPALAAAPDELLEALVNEAAELEAAAVERTAREMEAAATVGAGEDGGSSSSSATAAEREEEQRGDETEEAPPSLRMRPSPSPVVLPEVVVMLAALFLNSKSVAQVSPHRHNTATLFNLSVLYDSSSSQLIHPS